MRRTPATLFAILLITGLAMVASSPGPCQSERKPTVPITVTPTTEGIAATPATEETDTPEPSPAPSPIPTTATPSSNRTTPGPTTESPAPASIPTEKAERPTPEATASQPPGPEGLEELLAAIADLPQEEQDCIPEEILSGTVNPNPTKIQTREYSRTLEETVEHAHVLKETVACLSDESVTRLMLAPITENRETGKPVPQEFKECLVKSNSASLLRKATEADTEGNHFIDGIYAAVTGTVANMSQCRNADDEENWTQDERNMMDLVTCFIRTPDEAMEFVDLVIADDQEKLEEMEDRAEECEERLPTPTPSPMEIINCTQEQREQGLPCRDYDDHIETTDPPGICERTPEVQQAIIETLKMGSCRLITEYELHRIRNLPEIRPRELKAGDFAGLTNLDELTVTMQPPEGTGAVVPNGTFSGSRIKNLRIGSEENADSHIDLFYSSALKGAHVESLTVFLAPGESLYDEGGRLYGYKVPGQIPSQLPESLRHISVRGDLRAMGWKILQTLPNLETLSLTHNQGQSQEETEEPVVIFPPEDTFTGNRWLRGVELKYDQSPGVKVTYRIAPALFAKNRLLARVFIANPDLRWLRRENLLIQFHPDSTARTLAAETGADTWEYWRNGKDLQLPAEPPEQPDARPTPTPLPEETTPTPTPPTEETPAAATPIPGMAPERTTDLPTDPRCTNGTVIWNHYNLPGLVQDCTVLLAAKDDMDPDGALNWNGDTPIKEWQGVETEGVAQRVKTLDLHHKGLTGTISPRLGELEWLRRLILSFNKLTGEIPRELMKLDRLETLKLQFNSLTGEIPGNMDQLSSLRYLELGENQITGRIPPVLAGIPGIQKIHLGHNKLEGPIPKELGSAEELQILAVQDNQLTGGIPPELGNLDKLHTLQVSGNKLGGRIPPELGNMAALSSLGLEEADLEGEIPPEILRTGNLFYLNIAGNRLTGTIPMEVEELRKLSLLKVENNDLSGEIPEGVKYLNNLTSLRAGGNRLTGCMPVNPDKTRTDGEMEICPVGNPTEKPLTDSCSNGMAVPSPEQYPGLVKDCMTLLAVQDRLKAETLLEWNTGLPVWWWKKVTVSGRPPRVVEVQLSSYRADERVSRTVHPDGTVVFVIHEEEPPPAGPVPPELFDLDGLERLAIGGNRLTGPIPKGVGNLSRLEHLYMADNELTGPIPRELGRLENLEWLGLQINRFSGEIPDELGDLPKLENLHLGQNQLTGQIPRSLSKRRFTHITLSGNQFSGCLPTGLKEAKYHDLSTSGFRTLPSCEPVFTQESYDLRMTGSIHTGAEVGVVAAAPWDTGDQVTYAITDGNEDSLFRIKASTGTITLARAKTVRDKDGYTIAVEATDGYGQKATATVNVSLAG